MKTKFWLWIWASTMSHFTLWFDVIVFDNTKWAIVSSITTTLFAFAAWRKAVYIEEFEKTILLKTGRLP